MASPSLVVVSVTMHSQTSIVRGQKTASTTVTEIIRPAAVQSMNTPAWFVRQGRLDAVKLLVTEHAV